METILQFIKNDYFLLIILGINILLLILYIANLIKLNKIKTNSYKYKE